MPPNACHYHKKIRNFKELDPQFLTLGTPSILGIGFSLDMTLYSNYEIYCLLPLWNKCLFLLLSSTKTDRRVRKYPLAVVWMNWGYHIKPSPETVSMFLDPGVRAITWSTFVSLLPVNGGVQGLGKGRQCSGKLK